MNVHFICGYYPNSAHKKLIRRPEPYWQAHYFTWGVKVGEHKTDFSMDFEGRSWRITRANFHLLRKWFGKFIEGRITASWPNADPLLVPVPSKDAVGDLEHARSTKMITESMADTELSTSVSPALRWKRRLTEAHAGGTRRRDDLKQHLEICEDVYGKNVVLVDDLLSTGGNMLACRDILEAEGARVVGAVVCGKTIYDFATPPFGRQSFDLTVELADAPFA